MRLTRLVTAAVALAALASNGGVQRSLANDPPAADIDNRGRVHMRTKWEKEVGPWTVLMIRLTGRDTRFCYIYDKARYEKTNHRPEYEVRLPDPSTFEVSMGVPSAQDIPLDKEAPATAKVGAYIEKIEMTLTGYPEAVVLRAGLKLRQPLLAALKGANTLDISADSAPGKVFALGIERVSEALDLCLADKT